MDEGFNLQTYHQDFNLPKHTNTKTPAGPLDHDSPTARRLSCDCTYQSDS